MIPLFFLKCFRFIPAILLYFLPFGIQAQNIPSAAIKDWTKGRNELNKGNQQKAEKLFLKSIAKAPFFARVRLDLGALYFDQQRHKESAAWFRSAIDMDTIIPPTVLYSVGVNYWHLNVYDSAVWFFKMVLEEPSTGLTLKQKALKYYRDAGFLESKNYIHHSEVRILGTELNSAFAEYFPALVADENIMYFTRRKHLREDFYFSVRDSLGSWTAAEPFTELNSRENEGAITFSADGTVAFLTICDRKDGLGGCDIFQCRLENGTWTPPVNLGPNVNSAFWESQPSLSADGQTLYFVSNRPGGVGGRDIWFSRKDPKGSWLPAENIGSPINTIFDDISPYIHFGSDYLYFASEGHPGFGGLDIFLTRFDGERWSEPVNLGSGVNTRKDESGLVVALDGITAYFNRVYPNEIDRSMASNIYEVKLEPMLAANPAFYIKVKAFSQLDSSPLSPVIEIVDLKSGRRIGLHKIRNGGEILVCVPENKTIAVNAYHPGFVFYSSNFDPETLSTNQKRDPRISIYMSPLQAEAEMPDIPTVHTLANILFETGSASLRPESNYELDRLFELLNNNRDMRIQINGHTDNIGAREINLTLSEDRALSVRKYMINKGIAPDRITYKGFGPDQPIADNETPEGRSLNRRTEFVIIREPK